MDQPKKIKENSPVDVQGGFSNMKISGEEIRINLKNPEIFSMIKHYFIQNKDENNVENYVNAGGSITEICELLSTLDLKKEDQLRVIFEALRQIILKMATKKSEKNNLINDCKQLISSYIGEFQSILKTKVSTKLKKKVLQLLASVAVLDTALATLILLSLSLSKDDIDTIVLQNNAEDTESLRTAFIHFLLTFVIEQSPKVIEKLLVKKVWLPSIFPGLKYDTAFIVKLILSVLEEKIIDNKDLSKTNKLHVFSTMSLTHLGELYYWNPQNAVKEDDKIEIRNLTHGLLLKICTSVKNGIAFHDPTYGVTGLQRNYTISNFLLKLHRPWEDDLKRDLFHKVITAVPDLLKPILSSLIPNLKQSSPNWSVIFGFIAEIMADMKFDFTNLDPKFIPIVVKDLIVPIQILKAVVNEKLVQTDRDDKIKVFKLINVMLNRLSNISSRYLNDCEDSSFIKKEITSYLLQELPSSNSDLLKNLTESYYMEHYDCVKEIVRLFHICEEVCPELIQVMIRGNFNISDIVRKHNSHFFETGIRPDISALLDMIRLEMIANPDDVQEDATLKLFKYTTMGKEEEEIKSGISILKTWLNRSGLFVYNEKELSLWIYCIETHFNNEIGSIMASSIRYAFENTNEIYKAILDAHVNLVDDGSSYLNLDDFLILSEDDDVKCLDTPVNTILQLSPLLPSILQYLSANSCKENDDFVVAFIVHYLHQEVSFQPFIAFLKNYKCSAVEKIMPYIESWLEQPIYLSVLPFNKSVFYYASKSIIGEKKFGHEVVKDIRVLELLLEECIFMACKFSRLRLATPARLEKISYIISLCITESGVQVPLYHPALLDNFHPFMDVGFSDLTDLVVTIAEHRRLSCSALDPFSHRLASELKYATKICHILEDVSKLKKLLQIFKFSKSDTESLMSFVFSMKAKYFERNGKLSPWALIMIFLLNQAIEHKILMSKDDFKKLIMIVIKLIEKHYDTYDICEVFFNYLKALEVNICGTQNLLEDLSELFTALSTANSWHEGLCVFIHSLLDNVDYTNISIERSITLLASMDKIKKKHKEVVSNCSVIIFNGLCERPSPKWLVDLKKLIDTILSIDTCQKTCKQIKKHTDKVFTSVESLSIIKDIFKKSEETGTLLTILANWLCEELTKSESFDQIQCEEMSKISTEILKSGTDLCIMDSASNELILSLLLEGLKLPSHHFLDLLLCYIEQCKTKLPPKEIFEQLTSHSGFHDVMLGKNISVKNSCLNIFLHLIGIDNSLINCKFIPVILASYGATLCKTDQIIFKILYIYEKVGGINLNEWKPFVWGEDALEHYSARSKLSKVKPNPYITLDLLDKDVVVRTINTYPLHRPLNGDYEKDEGNIYDPAFYLTLFTQVTAEKNLGWKLANCGALALTLASLASSDSEIRASAYHVLQKMSSNIGEHSDNIIWKNLIDALRGGVVDLEETGNIRLSSIWTTFLARASIIMTIPDDPLYYSLHNFIFSKPHFKLNKFPAFFEIFHHTKGNQKLHRRWILEVIKYGIREQRDLQLALDCLIFKFILDYHSCMLATPKIKVLIEDIVCKCIEHVDEKQLLINNYSIISWISVANCNLINKLPQNINSQLKPSVDFVKQKLIKK